MYDDQQLSSSTHRISEGIYEANGSKSCSFVHPCARGLLNSLRAFRSFTQCCPLGTHFCDGEAYWPYPATIRGLLISARRRHSISSARQKQDSRRARFTSCHAISMWVHRSCAGRYSCLTYSQRHFYPVRHDALGFQIVLCLDPTTSIAANLRHTGRQHIIL